MKKYYSKKCICFIFKIQQVLFLTGIFSGMSFGQNWAQKANVPGGNGGRYIAVGFSIGDKGYIGTGQSNNGLVLRDFWEWDKNTNTWTQKADFGGTGRQSAAGFSIGSKGYIGTGHCGWPCIFRDFWEWNQSANIWTRKADFGGGDRYGAVGFSVGSKGYIGTGENFPGGPTDRKKDLWEYDPTTDTWIQKADCGGLERVEAVGFSIPGTGKGYIGTGYTSGGTAKDFWEWDQSTNTWDQKADFGGGFRYRAVGFSAGTKGYIGTGTGGVSCKDLWEFDPNSGANGKWTQKADFGGAARTLAVGFSIGLCGYIGTGAADGVGIVNDFWEYGGCSGLPVELISFSASLNQDNKIAHLFWQTANEISNDRFEVEKTRDGKNYEIIGTVKGSGTTTGIQSYSFSDYQPYKGISYYRLKQIDNSGDFTYSNLPEIYNAYSNEDLRVFPNPAKDKIQIRLPEQTRQAIQIKITDMTGRAVFNIHHDTEQENTELNIRDLPVGVYVIKILNAQGSETGRTVLIKQ